MEVSLDQIQKKRFAWGVVLAWVPSAFFFLVGLRNTFRGISSSKATGLGAVAGGLSEGFVTFGFVTMLLFQISAVTLLVRSFSKESPGRSIVTVASLFCCGVTLLMLASFAWLIVRYR